MMALQVAGEVLKDDLVVKIMNILGSQGVMSRDDEFH